MITLMLGDCLERMKEIESGSVDMILTDLPYGIIKKIKFYDYCGGAQWDTVIDTGKMMIEANRILRKNGKMCLFAQQPFTTELITKAIPSLPFSYAMIWEKDHFANGLLAKKAPVSCKDDILVFNKNNPKHDFEGLHPLRQYFKKVVDFIGLTATQIHTKLGHKRADHTFRTNSIQFSLCTEKTYNELIEAFEIDKVEGFKNFTELKKIDNDYRTQYRTQFTDQYPRVFNLWEGKKHKSNILKYKKDYTGHHPTQKPVLLLEDLIKTFSNQGDLVCDMTMGSGSTGVACVNTGRKFIGIEMDEGYFNIAKDRISAISFQN